MFNILANILKISITKPVWREVTIDDFIAYKQTLQLSEFQLTLNEYKNKQKDLERMATIFAAISLGSMFLSFIPFFAAISIASGLIAVVLGALAYDLSLKIDVIEKTIIDVQKGLKNLIQLSALFISSMITLYSAVVAAQVLIISGSWTSPPSAIIALAAITFLLVEISKLV